LIELKQLLAIYRRALLKVISIANLWVYLGFDQCCFLGRESNISQVTLLVVPGHRGLSSPGRDSWESTQTAREVIRSREQSRCRTPSALGRKGEHNLVE